MASQPTKSDVKDSLNRALNVLRKKDCELLRDNANERSITHKLAEYLQREFPDWHVDCEYNRKGHKGIKQLLQFSKDYLQPKPDDGNGHTVFPDIIVHDRGEPTNLLVIEVKKNGGSSVVDKEKLKSF